jgi:hypothetical protein
LIDIAKPGEEIVSDTQRKKDWADKLGGDRYI